MINKFKNFLCIFAHPDDEVLSAGGTINKLIQNKKNIYIGIPGTGIYSRNKKKNILDKEQETLKKDHLKALKKLGINKKELFYGDFPDNQFDKRTHLELVKWVEGLIKKTNPDCIFTHHKHCANIDHQYCFNACSIATRPFIKKKKITLISCETPSATGYLKPKNWEPNYYVKLNKINVKKKIDSMNCFSTEKKSHPHPRSGKALESLAINRGSHCGFDFAESFEIINTYYI